jgi:hypothetical protein
LGADLTGTERAFVVRAVRRRRLFLALSVVGVLIAVSLAAYYTYRKLHNPAFDVGARIVIVVLILLNSRQNLRQYRFAAILEKLAPVAREAR